MTFRIGSALLAAIFLTGCKPPAPGGSAAIQAEEPDAPKADVISDPALRTTRQRADELLTDLLAGRFDDDKDLSPVARKLKGYQSFSIKSQRLLSDGKAEFRGVLRGPPRRAKFTMTLVRQANGVWSIGMFSGPDAEQ